MFCWFDIDQITQMGEREFRIPVNHSTVMMDLLAEDERFQSEVALPNPKKPY